MHDLSSGILLAVGAAVVGGCIWLLKTGFASAVAKQFQPLAERLEQHMSGEEAERETQAEFRDDVNRALEEIKEQSRVNAVEHGVFEARLDRLEHP